MYHSMIAGSRFNKVDSVKIGIVDDDLKLGRLLVKVQTEVLLTDNQILGDEVEVFINVDNASLSCC